MKTVDRNQEIHMDIHEVGISMADSTKFGADHEHRQVTAGVILMIEDSQVD